MFDTSVFNKNGSSKSHKTTRRRNISVEKTDKIRTLFEQTASNKSKMGRTCRRVEHKSPTYHKLTSACTKSTASRIDHPTRRKRNDKLTDGRTKSVVAGTKQNAGTQSSNVIKNKLPITRARSSFEGGRGGQQLHPGAYQTSSTPGMLQTKGSNIYKDASLDVASQTVAHSQMKFWHLRKIIRETLVRYGDISENESSKELDEAISSYAIHYMLKPKTFKADLEASGVDICNGLNDDVNHYDKNANIEQNRTLHQDHAPISKVNQLRSKLQLSSDKSDVDISRRIDILLGRTDVMKGQNSQLTEDNGKSPENKSSEKILGDQYIPTITKDHRLHQDPATNLQDNINQLVDKCVLLLTETQNNMKNMENLIDRMHKLIITTHTAGDEVRKTSVPRISVTQGDEESLHQNETGLQVPLSHVTATPSDSSLNSGQISPYPRIYPMITIQGDAGDAVTMATNIVGGEHSEVDINSRMLGSPDLSGVGQMSLPKIDVSLDHDDMWKQIVEKSQVHRYPECSVTKLTNNHLDSKDVSKTKLRNGFSTPSKERISLESKVWPPEIPSRSSLPDTEESDQETAISSPPSYEGLLSTFHSHENEHPSTVFKKTQNRKCTCRKEHQPSQSLKLPEKTIKKLANVLSILDKMLHELSEVIDLLASEDYSNRGVQDQEIQDCATCSSSLHSVLSQTSSKATKSVKSSKYDTLMDKLSQGLQRMFTSKDKLKSPSTDMTTQRLHSMDASEDTRFEQL